MDPKKDKSLGIDVVANKAGFVEVSKCHHHSKCRGLKGYCIVAINDTKYGEGSLRQVLTDTSKLLAGRKKFVVYMVRAVDASMERLDESKNPEIQEEKKKKMKKAEKESSKAQSKASRKRKRGEEGTVSLSEFRKLRDENAKLNKKLRLMKKALEASQRLQSVMSV